MALEYVPQLDDGITIEELSLIIESSRENIDFFGGRASTGLYVLEAAFVIDGLKRAAKDAEPPTVGEVLRNLEDSTIWNAQVILGKAKARSASRTLGDRRIADQVLKVNTV